MGFRNKKKRQTEGFVFPPPFAGAIVVAAVLGLGYVWLCCRCEYVGRELKALESQREVLVKRRQVEESRWIALKSPYSLDRALRRFQLVMVWPRNESVVRMTDSDIYLNAPPDLAQNASERIRQGRTGTHD